MATIAKVLEGDLVTGNHDWQVAGRVWVLAMDVLSPTQVEEGDVVVAGDRPDVQSRAPERGAALLATSNSSHPTDEVLGLARERDAAVIVSRPSTPT